MHQPSTPPAWYRQFWPWFLIGVPALTVIACAYTIYLALTSPNPMVKDDYYKEGLAINQSLQQSRHAGNLGLSGDLQLQGSTLTLRLQPALLQRSTLQLQFIHPVAEGEDMQVALEQLDSGVFSAQVELPPHRWYVQLQGGEAHQPWLLKGEINPALYQTTRLLP